LDLGGQSIGKPTGFFNFVALNPTAINPEKELSRFRMKVEAGAKGAITQPVFDADQLLEFIDKFEKDTQIPILAGIWPLQSLRNAEFLANEVPGVRIPQTLLDRMSDAKKNDREQEEGQTIAVEILEMVYSKVQGIQVAAPFGRIKSAIAVLEAAASMGGGN
jgi:5,10-methylenetetrahydrofolate reductase